MDPTATIRDETRLAALKSYDILDTEAEAGFDGIVRLAAAICGTPVSLVSLVAHDRQWFKARVGFEACETGINSSVCAYALLEPDLLVIPDLTADPRTAANPLVTGEPHIRFYAGAPLRTPDGEVIGSLCVIDSKPRLGGLTVTQATALRDLAAQVMDQMALRRAVARSEALIAERTLADIRRSGLLDIGDRLRDAETADEIARVASEIVGKTLNASRVAFGVIDKTGQAVDIGPNWLAGDAISIEGRHRFADYGDLLNEIDRGEPLVIEDVRTDPRTSTDPKPVLDLGIGAMVNIPVRERGRTVAVLIVHDSVPRIWTAETVAFLRNVADRLQVGIERVRAEEQQEVLNRELSHRMKNMMAMIQAIANQTLKAVPDRGPVEALEKRIFAMSLAHDVLLQQSWAAADIGAVAKAVLGAFSQGERFSLSGPKVEMGPRATLSTSLLLHELATNALKYGALSAQGGAVAVSWEVCGRDGSGDLRLSWRETGGPAAATPPGKGFGTRLIQMGLVGTGGAEVRYGPMGLHADFTAPLDQVQLS